MGTVNCNFVIVTGNSTVNSTVVVADTTPGWLWLIGFSLTILSSLAVSLGTVLQKKAHMMDQALPPEKKAPRKGGMLLSRMWLIGFFLMAGLQIPLAFGALATASQSMVIPLGAGCTIVLTQILAVCLLKEHMGKTEFCATLLIIAGVILTTTASTGNDAPKPLSTCDILQRYSQPDYLALLFAVLSTLIMCILIFYWGPEVINRRWLPALYAYTAGAMGGFLNVMLKSVGMFLEGAISGTDPGATQIWRTIHPYYHIALIIFFAVGMISFINQGLEQFDAVSFLPLYNCLFIILSTLMGGIFFREFDNYTVAAMIQFPVGIAVTVLGIVVISCAARPERQVGMDEEEGQQFEMGAGGRRGRGPSDPLEQDLFDADVSIDEKAFGEAQAVNRLVLI